MRALPSPEAGSRPLAAGLHGALAGVWVLGALGQGGSPAETALVLAFLVLCLALHEVAHGWVALKRGDPTARDLGRLSLNPLVHIDPVWTIVVPLVTYLSSGFIFGGARPVPVNFYRLRHPMRDMALVAVAGPATNLLLALLFLVLWKVAVYLGPYQDNQLLPRVLLQVMQFNVLLTIFNLIPIPPLDGSRILAWLLPAELRPAYVGLERFGMLLIVALIFFVPPFQAFFWSGIQGTVTLLDTITGGLW